MPCVGHPWQRHFYDVWFIVMEVDTSMMIILVMSWNTSTSAQVWLSWFCHKFFMDVHAWQKTWPTVTNTYHHGSLFFCSDGTILMYRDLCYYSWILWCFSPSTLLWWIEFSLWDFVLIRLNTSMDLRTLDVCLAMNTHYKKIHFRDDTCLSQ